MQTYRNYQAKSLVKEMREIQHQTRKSKKADSVSEWQKTLDKYIEYANYIDQTISTSGQEADFIRKNIYRYRDALQTVKDRASKNIPQKLDKQTVKTINQTIDKLMSSIAELENHSASISLRS